MDLNEVSVFIRVVQAGSFSKAAQLLGMPNSTVSAKVSALEKRLGVTLIQRTTRKLHITPVGEAYFKKCIVGLEEIQAAESEIVSIRGEPQGLLKLTAPIELGSTLLPKIISKFTRTYPKVGIAITLSDKRIDLLAEGIDLAIRAGELKDSSLITKKLGSVYFAPFASPRYIKANGVLKKPEDLLGHKLIHFSPLSQGEWRLTNGKAHTKINDPGQICINDLRMIKQLAIAGDGIGLLPTFFCDEDVSAGNLKRVLPEWRTAYNPVQFVYPAQKFVMPKVSAFIALATDELRQELLRDSTL